MGRFTVRVVLHIDIPENEYTILHREMANEHFSQTILGKDGILYHLPHAEYSKIGNYTPIQVREAAIRAAKKAVANTTNTYSILVSGISNRYWTGLEPVVD